MRRLAFLVLTPWMLAAPALARTQDPHAGHHAPAPSTQAADPHAGHHMPAETPTPAPGPHAGHAGHAAPPASDEAPPPVPTDRDADRFFPSEAMAAARRQLTHEHGEMTWSKVMVEILELRPQSGVDGYAWEGRASIGGDINRLVIKSRGEGAHRLDEAELDILYSRAVTPYFNLEAGVRQDFEPQARAHLALGLDGMAPYGVELDGALFLSDRGALTARAEIAQDLRLTQRLILEPRVEANLSAEDAPSRRIGSGLSSVEVGLRLRYAIRPEFAPYIGVNYERLLGNTARFARAVGDDAAHTRIVLGIRSWF